MFDKRKLKADNEMLRWMVRDLKEELANTQGIRSQQERLMQRQALEIEALEQTIDGMEKDLNNKKKYIEVSDQARKKLAGQERELRLRYEKLAEDMRGIEVYGLCAYCKEEGSPEACGCTCCFWYAGELPEKEPLSTGSFADAQDDSDGETLPALRATSPERGGNAEETPERTVRV